MKGINELIDEFEDTCGTLAITHDSPDKQMIKELCEKYNKIKFNIAKELVYKKLKTVDTLLSKNYKIGYREGVEHFLEQL